MKTVLLVALGVLLGLFLFLLLAYWWVKRKLKKLFGELGGAFKGMAEGMASLPTYRIRLKPAPTSPWHHPEQIAEITNRLAALGFADAGAYAMEHTDSMLLRGMVHEGDRIIAAIYDTPAQDPVIDLVRNTESGTHLLASNVKTQCLDKPPWCRSEYRPGADVDELLAVLRGLDDRGPFRTITAGDFVEVFEADYAAEMDWRVDRGGYTDEEIERLAQAADTSADGSNEKLAGQMKKITVNVMRGALAGSLEETLRDAFLKQSEVSALEWERVEHRVRIIHKLSDETALVSVLSELFAQPDTDEADEEDESNGDGPDPRYESLSQQVGLALAAYGPREAFTCVAAELPRYAEMQKLRTLEKPSACDVYLMPQDHGS